jgi:uncharacterized protein YdhG (YjbR/CyaY superfamily)
MKRSPWHTYDCSIPAPFQTMLPPMAKPKDIDAYLAKVDADKRALLEDLRKTIHSIVPEAEECISYAMPAFRVKGGVFAGFLATAKGCSYFPFSGSTLATLADAVAGYSRTKSALHFDDNHPLPKTLVRKLIKARLAEMQE